MIYPNKPYLANLLIVAFCLLPMTKATANELPRQVNQLQFQVLAANEKIAMLASDQQIADRTISALQTGLNAAHQEISDLKGKHDPIEGTNAGNHRTANGHGR